MGADRAGDFGRTLREARERKGVTLREIANKTKISVAALEALERNDISRLPGGIFSRAFVRSYASEVGLDPEATIQDFIERFPHESVTAGHPATTPVEDYEEFESDRRQASTLLWILAVSVPLAAGVVYFSMVNRRAAAAPTPQAPTVQTAAPEPKAPVESAPPAVTMRPSPPAAQPQAAATAGETPPAPGAPVASDAASDRVTIGLSARRPVWVSATVDGQRTISRLLQTGEQQTIQIKREMVITAGDAAALSLTLNGAEGRSLGKSGEVVTATINVNNLKDYLQAR